MKSRMSGKIRPLFCSLAVMMAALAQPAQAWSGTGHQIIAWLAEKELLAKLNANHPTEAAAKWAQLATLIQNDPWVQDQIANGTAYAPAIPGEYHLADIASWADWVRQQDTNGDGKLDGDNITDHTVRIFLDGTVKDPPCTDKDPTQPDPFPRQAKRCADQTVTDFAPLIGNTAVVESNRLRALKYVVHLVGDLHQPLHGAYPGGYNYIQVPGRDDLNSIPNTPEYREYIDPVTNPNYYWSIHYVWDNTIIKDYMKRTGELTAKDFADWLSPQVPANLPVAGTPRQWADESRVWARDYIFTDAGYQAPEACFSQAGSSDGPSCSTTDALQLDPTYMSRKANIMVRRIEQAGRRLSCVLYHSLYPAEGDYCNP